MAIHYDQFKTYKVPGHILLSFNEMRNMAETGNVIGIGVLIGEMFEAIYEKQLEEIK